MELRPVVQAALEARPAVDALLRTALAHMQAAGYTQFNMCGLLLWYALGYPHALGSALWCNSCSIVFSYEMTRLVGAKALHSLKRQVPYRCDVIFHYAPFVLLRHVPPVQPIHALISVAGHAAWGGAHAFDLNRVYALDPQLSPAAVRFLWLCALTGHVAALLASLLWGQWRAMLSA